MATTTERMRAWDGPALLTYGFRPFFFGGAVWAVLAMLLWLGMLTGILGLPTAFDPVSWHAHEFLFGYLGAIVAGFLLTAVPNWTGRLPIVGWPLGGLFALWIAGRLAVATSDWWAAPVVAAVDLAFPVVLAAAIAREIIRGRNWRNLIVLAMLVALILGNAVFHWEAARDGGTAAQGMGLRIGLGAAVMMIAVIGGRVVPSFTRNWLVKRGATRLPVPPMARFDRIALLVLLVTLLVWVVLPDAALTGLLMLVAGVLHIWRLTRWSGAQTTPEPLLAVLHLAYAFVPLGALALGLAILLPDLLTGAAAQHLWMAGAIGLMTLAMMTRATLGHTGGSLAAGRGTTAIFALIGVAVFARLLAGVWPSATGWMHDLSGLGWIGAFAGFALIYGPPLLRPLPPR